MNKKVLIFTYYWPPAGGVAVQRWLKFSKYLPESGWEPIIITVENGSYPYYDESLLKEISPSLRVYRTETFEPFELYNLLRGEKGKSLPLVAVGSYGEKSFFQKISEYIRANLFVPDARKGWVKYAIEQAEEILKKEQIDTIVTTGPPHSTHLIGLKLKEKFKVKWLADFRDPWTGIFYNAILPRTEATKQKDKELETKVLQAADIVTVIGQGLKREFENSAKKMEVVPNGYDESDFNEFKSAILNLPSAIFTIRYVGNMMASQNVEALWKAIGKIRNLPSEIRIEFIGRVDEEVRKSLERNSLSDCFRELDFVDHRRAIQWMQEADLLLFIIPDVKDNTLIVTGKLFEYLASQTEIISFGPIDGDAAEILSQCGRKKMIDYHDEAETEKQLHAMMNYFSETKTGFKYNNKQHEVFSRRNQAIVLARLLEGI